MFLCAFLLLHTAPTNAAPHSARRPAKPEPMLERPVFEKPQFEKLARADSGFEVPGFEVPRFEREKKVKPGFENSSMDKPVFQRESFEATTKIEREKNGLHTTFPRPATKSWLRTKKPAHKVRIHSYHQLKIRSHVTR